MKGLLVLAFVLFARVSSVNVERTIYTYEFPPELPEALFRVANEFLYLQNDDPAARRQLWESIDAMWDAYQDVAASMQRSYRSCLFATYLHVLNVDDESLPWSTDRYQRILHLVESFTSFKEYVFRNADRAKFQEKNYQDSEWQRTLLDAYIMIDPDLFEIAVPELKKLLERDIASLHPTESNYEPRDKLCQAIWNYTMSSEVPERRYIPPYDWYHAKLHFEL